MAWAGSVTSSGQVTASTTLTPLSGSGTANTKSGSYTELENATPAALWGFVVQIAYHTSNTLTDDFLYDLATGAGGAEVVQVANNLVSSNDTRGSIGSPFHPLAVASSTRISFNAQSSSTSTTNVIGIALLQFEDTAATAGSTASQTYGANTADSGGASVDPGAVANTKGAYTELSASTSADFNYLVLDVGNQDNTARATATWLNDVATGAGGAEVVFAPNLVMKMSVDPRGFAYGWPWAFFTPTKSSGARLSMRNQCDITDGTDRLLDFVAHAYNVPDPPAAPGGGAFSQAVIWM